MTKDYLFPQILTLILWASLFFATWNGGDGDALFGAVVASLIVALIAVLPAAFCLGLIWNVATWAYDLWAYRPWRRSP